MSNAEAPISITSKTPSGSLVTIRANTGEELDQLVALSLASVSSAVTELEGAIRGSAPIAQANVAYATQQFQATHLQDTPPFNPAPSIGGGRNCPHGKMTALQGPSKNGGVYKGYFCPSAQGDPSKCKTIYVQKHEPDWNTFVPDKIK